MVVGWQNKYPAGSKAISLVGPLSTTRSIFMLATVCDVEAEALGFTHPISKDTDWVSRQACQNAIGYGILGDPRKSYCSRWL
jgi:hypothetical protein